MQLTTEQKAYFAEIAAQIVATHGDKAAEVLAADPISAVTAAHEKRLEFIQELLDQRTDRSKMARSALCAGVYAEANRVAGTRGEIAPMNPKYLAYCSAHGMSPEQMLEQDGGRMTGFIIWVAHHNREMAS